MIKPEGARMRLWNVLGSLMAGVGVLLNIGASSGSTAQENTATTEKTVTVATDGSGDFKRCRLPWTRRQPEPPSAP